MEPIHTNNDSYFVRSFAKINATLDVLGPRDDGYHELVTIMQTINLHDNIYLTTIEDEAVQLICNLPELSNDDNLVVRAASMMRQKLSITQGVHIELYKCIPVAAGLGGGSSNAAAILRALWQWWQLPLSFSDLHQMAASLGSDVPFFLTGGLALCEGRGEQITLLEHYWPSGMRWILLLKPAVAISTAIAFRNLSTSDYGNGAHTRAVCERLAQGYELAPSVLSNSFENSVFRCFPEVAQAKEVLLREGASVVHLCGTGSTLFAPFADFSHASSIFRRLQSMGNEVYLSYAVYPGPRTYSLG